MPSEGLRLGCSSGSTRCVIAKNYVLGQPGGGKRERRRCIKERNPGENSLKKE